VIGDQKARISRMARILIGERTACPPCAGDSRAPFGDSPKCIDYEHDYEHELENEQDRNAKSSFPNRSIHLVRPNLEANMGGKIWQMLLGRAQFGPLRCFNCC